MSLMAAVMLNWFVTEGAADIESIDFAAAGLSGRICTQIRLTNEAGEVTAMSDPVCVSDLPKAPIVTGVVYE